MPLAVILYYYCTANLMTTPFLFFKIFKTLFQVSCVHTYTIAFDNLIFAPENQEMGGVFWMQNLTNVDRGANLRVHNGLKSFL
jgi:hypothetical protein